MIKIFKSLSIDGGEQGGMPTRPRLLNVYVFKNKLDANYITNRLTWTDLKLKRVLTHHVTTPPG